MEPTKSDQPAPHAGEKEKSAGQGGHAKPPAIPPLPEPDVEGVGEESGPAAGKDSDTLQPSQRKMAKDATGF